MMPDNRLSETQQAAVAAGIEEAILENVADWLVGEPIEPDMIDYWLGKINEILSAPEVSDGSNA